MKDRLSSSLTTCGFALLVCQQAPNGNADKLSISRWTAVTGLKQAVWIVLLHSLHHKGRWWSEQLHCRLFLTWATHNRMRALASFLLACASGERLTNHNRVGYSNAALWVEQVGEGGIDPNSLLSLSWERLLFGKDCRNVFIKQTLLEVDHQDESIKSENIHKRGPFHLSCDMFNCDAFQKLLYLQLLTHALTHTPVFTLFTRLVQTFFFLFNPVSSSSAASPVIGKKD